MQFYVKSDAVKYFDRFSVKDIPKKIFKKYYCKYLQNTDTRLNNL